MTIPEEKTPPEVAPSSGGAGRCWLAWGSALVALVIGGTVVAKYQLVEPVPFAAACERHAGPWLGCLLRGFFVALFVQDIAGIAGVACGAVATLVRSRLLAFAAVALGGVSIVLYRYDLGAIAVLSGLLVLARALVRPQGPQRRP